eukprot:GHVT01099689.1.p1 GENE.GHVT01099689.1~~GHVT01099689.1.p1  ORF type:complete len:111 (+),score=12.78 GHVT01099689.1:19-351(+)
MYSSALPPSVCTARHFLLVYVQLGTSAGISKSFRGSAAWSLPPAWASPGRKVAVPFPLGTARVSHARAAGSSMTFERGLAENEVHALLPLGCSRDGAASPAAPYFRRRQR